MGPLLHNWWQLRTLIQDMVAGLILLLRLRIFHLLRFVFQLQVIVSAELREIVSSCVQLQRFVLQLQEFLRQLQMQRRIKRKQIAQQHLDPLLKTSNKGEKKKENKEEEDFEQLGIEPPTSQLARTK